MAKDYEFTFDGSVWSLKADVTDPDPAPPTVPEKKNLTFTYRYGAAKLIQVNTNLPTDLTIADFLVDAEGCDIKQSGSHSIGWISMAKPEGESQVVLTFNFNDAFAIGDTFTLGKDSVFKFGGSDVLYTLTEDYTFTFNGTDFAEPQPEPEEPVHTHKYVKTVVKATTTKAGSITEKCACGEVKSKTTIAAASKISINKTSVTYDKKTQKVTVTVKDSKGKALATSQYSVSGTVSAKKVGTYKVTVTLKGNYAGSKTFTWKINPKATKVTSVKAGKKSLTVKWSKQATETTGYKIQVSTDKNFKKNVKTVTINKNKTVSKKITGLKKNKKYYVRICTYKGSNASAWAKYSKSVKVK